jgi:hypothetical protein
MELPRLYEQLIRYDGRHQRQLFVVNPSYPDPGPLTSAPDTRYVLGAFRFQRTLRYSGGIEQRLSPRARLGVLYAYHRQFQVWRGRNLNAPVNGVRPDPALGNVIEALTDAQLWNQTVTATFTLAVAAPSPALNAARLNWRRLSLSATWVYAHGRQNGTGGPFAAPASGTLDTEWATYAASRVTASLTSTQLRHLNVNVSWTTLPAPRYTITTGVDDNQDGILNDRPAGVAPRSLRGARQAMLNVRATYALVATAPGAAAARGRPYRVSLTANIVNLTNRANYSGYSGNMASPDFEAPTLVVNPRRVEFGMTLGF